MESSWTATIGKSMPKGAVIKRPKKKKDSTKIFYFNQKKRDSITEHFF